MTRRVVVDSSPLIVLFKANLEEILPKLFDEIIVPDPVRQEIQAGPRDDPARTGLRKASWVMLDQIFESQVFDALGAGESSVISMALGVGDAKVVLDDAAARKQARSHGLSVIGTGGLLVLAKRSGVIDSFNDSIDAVIRAGLWIDPATVELLRRKAQD